MEQLLKVADVCVRTSLSKTTVWELIARGDMPSIKIGGTRRIREADLDEWIRRRAEPEQLVAAGA